MTRLLAILFACGLAAQQPVRDPSIDFPAGAGVIEGSVVADEPNGQPLRRVAVELVPGVAQRFTTTDAQGHFVFTGLPAGRYFALRVSRPGFVATNYGQKRIGGSGAPIVLADGQHLTVAVKMLRSAVISGVVLDQGHPAARTSVSARLVRVVSGERVYAQANEGRAITDERGAYRISDLAPGDYVLSAASERMVGDPELRRVTPEEIKWAQQQLQAGTLPATAVSPGRVPPPPPSSRPVAYSPVFYPGTTDFAEAAAVTVTAGQERSGVDMILQLVQTAKIEGSVLDPDGQPAQKFEITFASRGVSGGTVPGFAMAEMLRAPRPTIATGTFSFAGVRPGKYTIAVRAASRATPAVVTLWASVDIFVDGTDQSGIQLRLEPGMALSGRVAFEDATQPASTSQPRATIGLSTAPDGSGTRSPVNVPAVSVAPDGTFTIDGVPPGRYFLRLSPLVSRPPAWLVKSARVGDIEAADHPFEVRPSENISGIAVTFTNKTGEVSGTLVGANGQVAPDYSILLFPTDKELWSSRSSRLPRTSRTGSDGKFRFMDLLAGEWYLAAVSDFDPEDLYSPEFLSQVAAAAFTVTLAEGEKKVQDLKIVLQLPRLRTR